MFREKLSKRIKHISDNESNNSSRNYKTMILSFSSIFDSLIRHLNGSSIVCFRLFIAFIVFVAAVVFVKMNDFSSPFLSLDMFYLKNGFGSKSTNFRKMYPNSSKQPIDYYNNRKFYPGASYAFIQYSAYRTSPSRISTMGVGESKLSAKHTIGPCTWYGNGGEIISGQFYYYPSNANAVIYEEEIFHCHLDNPTGDSGGVLIGNLNGEDRIMFTEDAGRVQNWTEPSRWNRTYCSAPLHGQVDGRAIFEWMEYHRVLTAMDNFIFYNIGSMDAEVMAHIAPYVDAGMVKVVNFTEITQFDVFYYGQLMASWDCIHSIALHTKWVFLQDLDEYVHVFPPHTMSSLLQENEEKPWMSLGRLDYPINICNDREGDDLFFVEKMVFREFKIHCFSKEYPKELCPNWHGLRKLIVNPRKIMINQVHMVVVSTEGDGIHFNALTEVRYNHFRHLLVKNQTLRCVEKYSDSQKFEWLARDYSQASNVGVVKSHPLVLKLTNN